MSGASVCRSEIFACSNHSNANGSDPCSLQANHKLKFWYEAGRALLNDNISMLQTPLIVISFDLLNQVVLYRVSLD